jgi:hypothetical protein
MAERGGRAGFGSRFAPPHFRHIDELRKVAFSRLRIKRIR